MPSQAGACAEPAQSTATIKAYLQIPTNSIRAKVKRSNSVSFSFPLFKEILHGKRFLEASQGFLRSVALLLSTFAMNICTIWMRLSSLWKNAPLLGHAKHFGRTISGEEGVGRKRSKLLLPSPPACQKTPLLSRCQSWLKYQEQVNHKVEIQVFSSHFQGKTKGYTAAISGITERLLSVLVIKEKKKRWPLILTPSRFICDNASTEAGVI